MPAPMPVLPPVIDPAQPGMPVAPLGVTDPDATRRHLSVALEHARRISATLRNLRLVGPTRDPL